MVARINAAHPKRADQRPLAVDLAEKADALRAALETGRLRDEAAFAGVVAAQALPKGMPAQDSARALALETALTHAAAEPLHGAKLALDVLMLAQRSLQIQNRNLASDLGCAAEFASAALHACAYNVRINHRFMHDADTIQRQGDELERYERRARALLQSVRASVTHEMR